MQGYSIRTKLKVYLGSLAVLAVSSFVLYLFQARQQRRYDEVNQTATATLQHLYELENQVERLRSDPTQSAELAIPFQACAQLIEELTTEALAFPAHSAVSTSVKQIGELWQEQEREVTHIRASGDQVAELRVWAKSFQIRHTAQSDLIQTMLKENADQKADSEFGYQLCLGGLAGACLLVLLLVYQLLSKKILSPLQAVSQVAALAAQGDLSQRAHVAASAISPLASALNGIQQRQVKMAEFVEKMGDDRFQSDYPLTGENDHLGLALKAMHEKLLTVSLEEKRRNWASEGYATFADMLRASETSVQLLAENVLFNLVKYLGVNQGAFFVMHQQATEEPYLEQVATYAWNRKKWVQKRFALGEGLAGQAALEGDILHLTEVPNQYAKITSGLGEANPRVILILPLKANQIVQGVIEIASFRPLEAFEIAFAEKLAETIAATLASVQTNERTRKLLEESHQLNEHLRAHEEVLRLNTEEMQLVQEQMRRKEVELEIAKENLSEKLEEALVGMRQQIQHVESEKQKNIAILEGCVDGVIVFDQNGLIEFFNRAAEDIWGISRQEVLGKPIQRVVPLKLESLSEGFQAYYTKDNQRKPVSVRTELSVSTESGDDIDILLTLTHAQIESRYTFTAFVQRISVELF